MARSSQPEADRIEMSRSNSSHSITETRIRPKSRGSTTSLQSVGVGNAFQPPQPHGDQNTFYLQHAPQHMQAMYGQRPDEALIHYQHQMAQMQQQSQHMMDAGVVVGQPDMRPMSQHGFHEMQQFPMQYPNGMPQYPVPPPHMQHMRRQSSHYEGSPAPDDSNTENGGAKRRKGTASSMANDQELRRLLAQYQGKTLKEIALEVQKNEGSGGKSEKAKQVFAMLWLQESCKRSTNSVRRDRVFARYTERCGNERVPTLNPASFGKLVRIIFPNVQTRRLGVRGESKYHYVDLSLISEDDDRQPGSLERPSTSGSLAPQRPGSAAGIVRPLPTVHARAASAGQLPVQDSLETADFPAPNTTFFSPASEVKFERPAARAITKMDCQYLNTPTVRISTRSMSNNLIAQLPSLRANLPATMAAYVAMPSDNSLSQFAVSASETPIELPDIHEYLSGVTYDHHIAKLLHDLYRSYCIDVVDAFRKCKEKSFFNHHSAFNGKMTVPVSKLFTMECVAPWIQECDMRMYKQIVRFLAPLAQQNVPDPVWAVFDRISVKLVPHLVAAFEEKCPVHVVAAKVVPAARFTTLLKKLKGANAAALQVSRMLEDPQQRTQMWLDAMAMIDPEGVLDDSTPPPESLDHIRGMLKTDLRIMIAPVDDALVIAAENDPTSTYAEFVSEPANVSGVLPIAAQSVGLLERWVQWLERLPTAFDGHHPQCMMDWHLRFWRSVMSHIGNGGARSYQAWWYLENFATHMLAYMTQMEGILMSSEEQKFFDQREAEKRKQSEEQTSLKRKRAEEDVGGEKRSSGLSQPMEDSAIDASATDVFPSPNLNDLNAGDEVDAEMDEIRRGGPLDLPSIRTGLSSPLKREMHSAPQHHDDSGIDLGLDGHADPDAIEAEKEAKRFNKRDWFLSSDPVEAPGMSGLGVTV